MDDGYRGRVFSFYDMMFNITFVAGAALSAAFMPVTGQVRGASSARSPWATRSPRPATGWPGRQPSADGGAALAGRASRALSAAAQSSNS